MLQLNGITRHFPCPSRQPKDYTLVGHSDVVAEDSVFLGIIHIQRLFRISGENIWLNLQEIALKNEYKVN
jgi:hypothetical protein